MVSQSHAALSPLEMTTLIRLLTTLSHTGGRTRQHWAFLLPKDNCELFSLQTCIPHRKDHSGVTQADQTFLTCEWPLTQGILGREIFSWWPEIAEGNA